MTTITDHHHGKAGQHTAARGAAEPPEWLAGGRLQSQGGHAYIITGSSRTSPIYIQRRVGRRPETTLLLLPPCGHPLPSKAFPSPVQYSSPATNHDKLMTQNRGCSIAISPDSLLRVSLQGDLVLQRLRLVGVVHRAGRFIPGLPRRHPELRDLARPGARRCRGHLWRGRGWA